MSDPESPRRWATAALFASVAMVGLTLDLATKEIAWRKLVDSVAVDKATDGTARRKVSDKLSRLHDIDTALGELRYEVGLDHSLKPLSRPKAILRDVFEYRYTMNKGVIFGLGPEYGKLFFVIAIVAVPVLVAIFWRIKKPTFSMTTALGMILGGTAGNLADRIRFEAVQDFIYVRAIKFPIFNLADSCILIGTILLMVELSLFEEKKKKHGSAAAAGPESGAPQGPPGAPEPR